MKKILYFQNETSEKHAKNLLYEAQLEIPQRITSEPIFGINDCYNKKDQDYYDRNVKQYSHAAKTKDLKELFSLNFFFDKNQCYQYDYENIIDITEGSKFIYWFALKLRQYKYEFFELENFLNFQLDTNFNNNKKLIKKYLTIIIKQHGNDMFNKILIDSIQEWIDNLEPTTSQGNIESLELAQTTIQEEVKSLKTSQNTTQEKIEYLEISQNANQEKIESLETSQNTTQKQVECLKVVKQTANDRKEPGKIYSLQLKSFIDDSGIATKNGTKS